MNQAELFDPSRTIATACPVPGCGAVRLPQQERVPTCAIDQQRATGDWPRRPQSCLNSVDPATAEWPEGF